MEKNGGNRIPMGLIKYYSSGNTIDFTPRVKGVYTQVPIPGEIAVDQEITEVIN